MKRGSSAKFQKLGGAMAPAGPLPAPPLDIQHAHTCIVVLYHVLPVAYACKTVDYSMKQKHHACNEYLIFSLFIAIYFLPILLFLMPCKYSLLVYNLFFLSS